MDEQSAKLIEKLAEKLGTTAQYMWAVLVEQAPVYGISHLIMWLSAILIFGCMTIMSHKHGLGEPTTTYHKTRYDGNNF